MKSKLFFCAISFTALLSNAYSQFTPSGTSLTTTKNVGIGESNPSTPLYISNTIDAIATFQTLDDKWLYTNWKNKSGVRKAYMGLSSDLSNFIVGLENGADKFTIPSGNVGIGTKTPTQKLQVNGNAIIGDNNWGALIVDGKDKNDWMFNAHNDANGFFIRTQTDTGSPWSSIPFTIRRTTGNVGIGTLTPDSKLTVAGNIHAREVKVTIDAGADFVFEEDYSLPKLEDVASFVKTNKHLPEIDPALIMEKNGLELGEMNIKLLQKVEELTLYTIEQEKKLKNQELRLKKLEILLLK